MKELNRIKTDRQTKRQREGKIQKQIERDRETKRQRDRGYRQAARWSDRDR